MLYILHGDDIVSLNKRQLELTSGRDSSIVLSAEKNTTSEILQALGAGDLFVDKRCVVIEKILKLPKADFEKMRGSLQKTAGEDSILLILSHNTELSKIFLSKFKIAKVEVFLLPKLFFSFLDNLYPQNFVREVELLSQMKNVDAEQIFYAMIKRLRQISILKSGAMTDETSKMSPWQLEKIHRQAKFWNTKQLESVYKKLFNLEIKMKSSGVYLPLKNHLDILLLSEVN